ncbi:Platelet-activating factor acetylhydrolase [Perkinsus olseni]|uniref:1-alkyl-2-acetylglycerophosphocholine esterase n=2 Tax=Perkinsus olseni TaxID=32597 RepID=A0A7J6NE51_PEROL|nr:Platelet-activating factor acetylhydrolase [Perkinsus olseni]
MDPLNDISDVFQEATRTKNEIDDLLGRMEEAGLSTSRSSNLTTPANRPASEGSEVAVQQRMAMLMQQLVKLTNRLEELARGPQGSPMWRKRAARMRDDVDGIKVSTDRLLNHIFRTRQREKLFGAKNSTENGGDQTAESQLLRERQALQQSAGMLDSILGQGHATLGKMTQQNTVLKTTRRKMYDVLNAVGLSSTLSTSIDRRQRVDAWIVRGGMDASSKKTGCTQYRVPGGVQGRIFYPAVSEVDHGYKQTTWFTDLERYATGQLDVSRALFRRSRVMQIVASILEWMVKIVAYVLPSRLFVPKLSSTYDCVEPVEEGSLPLVVFSHGLTGNGDENAMLCSALTREIVGGAIVAEFHHQDGSACEAVDEDGHEIPYIPDPIGSPDPRDLRPKQVRQRANEMKSVIEYLCAIGSGEESSDPLLNRVARLIDPRRIIPVGYSFGGATVAEYCSTVGLKRVEDKCVPCAVLMDPWTYVTPRDGSQGFNFPERAHKEGIQTPTLILGSEEFSKYPGMRAATVNLHDKSLQPGSRLRVVDKTRHGNFMELCFWMPQFLVPVAARIGFYDKNNKSARGTYCKIIASIANFIFLNTSSHAHSALASKKVEEIPSESKMSKRNNLKE